MKKYILLVLVALFAFQVDAQTYRSLDDETKDDVTRSEWRKAVKETEGVKEQFDIVLQPIERIVKEVQPIVNSRSLEALDVSSWGRDVLLPSSVRQRVVNECSKYPFVRVTVDSGVDPNHSEYLGDWWLPPSNYSGDQNKHWHGTHVTGIMWQMVGELAKQKGNVRFKDAQILGGTGGGSFAGAVNMANSETSYFANMSESGVGVIFNNSWGGSIAPYAPMEAAISKSLDAGMIWTAANGNTGGETLSYPASGKDIISVASLDSNIKRSSFSTIGDFTNTAMPGRSINSTLPDNKEGIASGTSMADPFITGLCGLAYGKYGDVLQGRNMLKYINAICTDIDPNGFDKETGYGIPYVITMLDTNPCDVIDCGGTNPDPDPDPPTPDPELNYVRVSMDDGYLLNWKNKGETTWRIMSIPKVELEQVGNGSIDELYLNLDQFVPNYFLTSGIELAENMTAYDATKWAGIFLGIIADQKGLAVSPKYVEGIDKQTKAVYSVHDFSKNTTNDLSTNSAGVRLVTID